MSVKGLELSCVPIHEEEFVPSVERGEKDDVKGVNSGLAALGENLEGTKVSCVPIHEEECVPSVERGEKENDVKGVNSDLAASDENLEGPKVSCVPIHEEECVPSVQRGEKDIEGNGIKSDDDDVASGEDVEDMNLARESIRGQFDIATEEAKLRQCILRSRKEIETVPKPSFLSVDLLPHQQKALEWMLWRESEAPAGGIVAHLGFEKMIVITALIAYSKQFPNDIGASGSISLQRGCKKAAGNLVVFPSRTYLNRWKTEFLDLIKENAPEITMITFIPRGEQDLEGYDLVLATVGNVRLDRCMTPMEVEIARRAGRPWPLLRKYYFERIIVEAQDLKHVYYPDRFQAICALDGVRRWALTSTPIPVSRVTDCLSVIRFLRATPFSDVSVWDEWANDKTEGPNRLNLLLKTIQLRRGLVDLDENCIDLFTPQ